MSEEATPRLLHFRVSHYNEKVRWALDRKRWPHRREALVPGFHVPRVRWLSGQNQVPVLQLGGRVIAGSNHILEEIERLRPEPPLFPADPAQRRRALEIQSYFDDEVAPDVRRLFWACYLPHPGLCAAMAADGFSVTTRRLWRASFALMRPVMSLNMQMDKPSLERASQRLPQHFDYLERAIGASGYLVGDRFSGADLTAAAVMTALVRPPQFPYPLPQPWPPEFTTLRERYSTRSGFGWVLDIYRRERDASCEISG